ncbi:YggT family protein [Herbaspirillum sp. RTI4]|uniref:YggT family protein n=1 Tax=Herbaspirillum sp. RTI4 TaxID=3048640 RepID=UPI002AB4B737|nr:YggT family protein [Herbaspirillum sp. RTI4]MDY7577518.1 YggT family protein [Herbaspirillum sp. RTI4]MEA9980993.1 YggT family protein [Herbaspirillum sp. RTI4]
MIVDTIASILTGALLLRFWTQVVRVRPPASLAQFIFHVTDWLVKPLRRVTPSSGGYDWASLIGAYLVIVLSTVAGLVVVGLAWEPILLLSVLRFVQWIFYGFMATLIVEAIFSWVNPHAPLAPYVGALNEPLLRPLRRVIPLFGNVDLSPLAALILLQIGLKLISALLISFP